MKKCSLLFFSALLISSFSLLAQTGKYGTYYDQRASLFETLGTNSKDILFLGNSITDGGEFCELFNNKHVKNRGISGDITLGVYDRLESITRDKPKKIFLLIGVNDLARGFSPDSVVKNIALIVEKIQQESPKTQLYLQSIMPVNDQFGLFSDHTNKEIEILQTNHLIQTLAKEKNLPYIDLYTPLLGEEGQKLNPLYTNDGLHLLGTGYLKWKEIVAPYVK